MSVELLPTLEKKESPKNNNSKDLSNSTDEKQKGGMSLFDSLLKDAKVETKESGKDSTLSDAKDTTQTKDTIKDKTSLGQKEETTDKKTQVKGTQDTNNITINKQEAKQIAEELVEIVVEKVKNKKEKSILLADESKIKEKVVELKDTIKNGVKEKTADIKEAITDIKKNITELKTDIKEGNTPKAQIEEDGNTAENLEKKTSSAEKIEHIKSNTSIIEESAEKIKTAISKVEIDKNEVVDLKKDTQKKDIDATDVKSSKPQLIDETNIEKLKTQVEQKADEIKIAAKDIKSNLENLQEDEQKTLEKVDKKTTTGIDIDDSKSSRNILIINTVEEKANSIEVAVDDIEKSVSKVNFVSTDEIMKSIQELKKELQNPKVQVTVAQNTQDKNTSSQNDSNNNKGSLLANGILQDQKTIKEKVSLQQALDAKNNIEEKKNMASVKQSANMLELNPEEASLEAVGEKGESKVELFAKNNKEFTQNFFQQKTLNRMIIDNELQERALQTENKTLSQNSIEEQRQNQPLQKEVNVSVNVPQSVVESFQSKVIGAQQRMGSFMSEVARNMYLNYKPPFTSFRMSLNPANLGSISIMMRASKVDNSISVSMNMNNSSTMEAFIDNKTALQSALQKQLGESSTISLDFGMQNENNGSEFESFSQNNSQQNNRDNQEDNAIVEEQELEEKIQDSTRYM